MDNKQYLGQGLNFPIILINGSAILSGYQELIESSIKTILSWDIYSRPFNPRFGSRLWQLIGEPNDIVLRSLVRRFIIDALSYWERRITILDATITSLEADKIVVNIKYKILSTAQLKELDYTFYTTSYVNQ